MPGDCPELSLVIPARDEEENIHPLLDELERVLTGAGLLFEVIVVDSGCALRVVRRARSLPLFWEGMHRFLPFLEELNGGTVREIAVGHRPRHAGHSKYHIGFVSRGLCGLLDLFAVRWMVWRRRDTRPDDVV